MRINVHVKKRLRLMRKQNSCDASEKTLQTARVSLVESVVTFDKCTWCGHPGGKEQTKASCPKL